MSAFKTIAKPSEGIYKEKGSKFFAFAVPIKNEQEVKSYIAQKRKEHIQAVHVCSAFRIGADLKLFRFSDDGEPSNSAGPPILGQIQAYGLTNVLIAVVRYYGGTNLGVGGLISAYRNAAKDALENAQIILKEESIDQQFTFPYEKLHLVMEFLKREKIQILKQEIGSLCLIKVSIERYRQKEIESSLKSWE